MPEPSNPDPTGALQSDFNLPEVLDADRLIQPERDDMSSEEHQSRAHALENQLRKTCDYGTALHAQLAAVRAYLAAHFPPDRHDDDAWQAWRSIYGSTTSSLAGPTGDNGFGGEEAQRIAQAHRNA